MHKILTTDLCGCLATMTVLQMASRRKNSCTITGIELGGYLLFCMRCAAQNGITLPHLPRHGRNEPLPDFIETLFVPTLHITVKMHDPLPGDYTSGKKSIPVIGKLLALLPKAAPASGLTVYPTFLKTFFSCFLNFLLALGYWYW